ncbi:hypothetical protein GVAV_000628 [Gurleya vavrai]
MIKKLLFVLVLILSLFYPIHTCFPKKKIEKETFEILEKWENRLHTSQYAKSNLCLGTLEEEIFFKLEYYEEYWLNQAFKKLHETFDEIEKKNFALRKMETCLKIVAKQKSKDFLCPIKLIDPGRINFLEYYAVLEFYECLRQKNIAFKKKLTFFIPNINLEDANF